MRADCACAETALTDVQSAAISGTCWHAVIRVLTEDMSHMCYVHNYTFWTCTCTDMMCSLHGVMLKLSFPKLLRHSSKASAKKQHRNSAHCIRNFVDCTCLHVHRKAEPSANSDVSASQAICVSADQAAALVTRTSVAKQLRMQGGAILILLRVNSYKGPTACRSRLARVAKLCNT